MPILGSFKLNLLPKDKSTSDDSNYYKSLVFQAKKGTTKINTEQWDNMKRYFPNGSIFVGFNKKGYSAFSEKSIKEYSLCKIIANEFLQCKIGIEGLYYDSNSNKFINLAKKTTIRSLKHELLIEVLKT